MYQKISRVNFYLILSLFIAIIEISPGDISEDLRAGEENFKKRDYKSALRNYKSAISINPSSKKALLGFAKSSVVIGSKDDAKEAFQKLLSIDPKNKEAALGLIGLLTNERKFDEALKLISIHLEDDKYNPDLLASEADIYLRMGKKKELALKKLEEISSKIAGNVKFSVSLALANSMNGRTQRAQVILDKLISEYPDNPIPFLEKAKLNLQIAKSQSGDQVTKLVNEALSLLQTALSLDSQNPEARVFIVNVFLWLENFEEAARIQSSLIKDFPFTPEFRYMNAFLSEKTGKTEIAEMDYKKLLELNELDELGRFAAEDFALRSLKENSPLRSKLGEYRLEEFKKGERNFIYRDSGFNIFRASKLIPENNQLKRERLEYYLKRGYIKDFISVLIKLKKDNPDDFKLHNRLENVLKKFREGLSFKEGLEVISRSGIKENYERNPPEIFIFDLTSGNFPGSHPNASSLISGAIKFYLRLMPEIKIISGKEEDAIRNDIMTKKGAEKYTGGINYSPDIVSSLDIMRQSGMPVRYLGYGSFSTEESLIRIKFYIYDRILGKQIAEFKLSSSDRGSIGEITTRLTERIIAILPKSGRLIKIKDDEIAINLGKRDGLQVGSRLRIERTGKEIGKAKVTAIDHFISTALPETKGWEKTFGLGDFISVENAESSK